MEGVDYENGSTYEVEYIVTKVTPRKVVCTTEWTTPVDDKENHHRDKNIVDRLRRTNTFKVRVGSRQDLLPTFVARLGRKTG